MPVQFTDISFLLIAMFIIVGLTNVITEVVKMNINKIHPNVACTLCSIILTLIVLIAYCQIQTIVITWYIIVSGIIFGFVCAFVAMQNFDKLIKLFQKSGVPVAGNK